MSLKGRKAQPLCSSDLNRFASAERLIAIQKGESHQGTERIKKTFPWEKSIQCYLTQPFRKLLQTASVFLRGLF